LGLSGNSEILWKIGRSHPAAGGTKIKICETGAFLSNARTAVKPAFQTFIILFPSPSAPRL
jgi:hypothetical protein